MMNIRDEIVDVYMDDVSFLRDLSCQVNAVTITALTKKQYLVDIPGGNGNRDLSDWFGAPNFEARTMTFYVQSTMMTATDFADFLANRYAGKTVNVQLSIDPGLFRTGMVTKIVPSGPTESDEVAISVVCDDPYRYCVHERMYRVDASDDPVSYTWRNQGTVTVIPSVTVDDTDVVIQYGSATYTMTKGTFLMPGLAIDGKSDITVSVSGGTAQVRYREAVL